METIDFSIIRPEDRRNADMTNNTIALFGDFEVMGGGGGNGPQGHAHQNNYQPNQNYNNYYGQQYGNFG